VPISFSQTTSIPDLLASDRFVVYLPVVSGSNSELMSILNAEVTLPPYEVGQVLVKMFGWSRAFAGRRVQQNSLSMAFYEVAGGRAHISLCNWQEQAAGMLQAGGAPQTQYAQEIKVVVYDTTGKSALTFTCNNCWPMRITPPAMAHDSSTPARIECDFSVDSVDLTGVSVGNVNYGSAYDLPISQSPIGANLSDLRMTARTGLELMNSFARMQAGSPAASRSQLDRLSNSLGLGWR